MRQEDEDVQPMNADPLHMDVKGKQRARAEDEVHVVIKAEPQDINMSGLGDVGDEPVSTQQESALDTSSYENDMAEFLGGLSDDVVMSLPGSPHKPHRTYAGESSKRRRKSWHESGPSRWEDTDGAQ
jgi:hypothetical protein